MISPPTILVQCDQRPAGERCRHSEAMTISMSLDGSAQQVRNLFLATHAGWVITTDGRVFCPQCASIARARTAVAAVTEIENAA